jgi:hypothetical protein
MGRSGAYRGGGAQRKRDRNYWSRNAERCMNPDCQVLLDWVNPHLPNSGTVDHDLPLARAEELGYTVPELRMRWNQRATCFRCNRAKSDLLPGETRERNRNTGRFVHKDHEVRNGRCECGEHGPHHHADGSFHDRSPHAAVSFVTGRDWTSVRSKMTPYSMP